MNKKVFEYLVKRAKDKAGTIYYSELCVACNLPFSAYSKNMFKLLEELTRDDLKKGRPFLTVFVVTKETGLPGDGFYELCHELGYKSDLRNNRGGKFEKMEMEECYDHWKKTEITV